MMDLAVGRFIIRNFISVKNLLFIFGIFLICNFSYFSMQNLENLKSYLF